MSDQDIMVERAEGEWRLMEWGCLRSFGGGRVARVERLGSGRFLAEAGAKVMVFDGLDEAQDWCVEVLE